ncbi:hypothetical protein [Streptomyces sp. NPDC050738]|uniref:hypothetical protein n=1 Tax=Streptomyces sp. NPDC050738 TaxID=3154744 RepID=UPI003412FC56
MQQDESSEVIPARAEAEARALLRAGRLGEARRAARDGMSGEGSSAGLYAVLGRAHAAEDEDDHDGRAEAAYVEGLEAFPDDLDLLAAYAELAANTDAMEYPGRRRRGMEAAARLQELSPGSPQAAGAPKAPHPQRVQRFDAQAALKAGAEERDRVRELAAARPLDARLAVLDETLTALSPRGRGALRAMVRAPFGYVVAVVTLQSAVMLSVPAFRLPWWVLCAALFASVPKLVLRRVLKGARERAAMREVPPGAVESSAPDEAATEVLPPVTAHTTREKSLALTALVVALAAATGSVSWGYAHSREYPHYTLSPPEKFQGMDRLYASPLEGMLDTAFDWTETAEDAPQDAESFTYVYGDADRNKVAVYTAGAKGDFHGMPGDMVEEARRGLEASGLDVSDHWSADPGRYGGSMECVAYANLLGNPMATCSWADDGSFGSIVIVDGGIGHDAISRTARALRQTVLDKP